MSNQPGNIIMISIAVLAVIFGILATVVGLVVGTFTAPIAALLLLTFAAAAFIIYDSERGRK